jgi:6-phosphofructokinase 1
MGRQAAFEAGRAKPRMTHVIGRVLFASVVLSTCHTFVFFLRASCSAVAGMMQAANHARWQGGIASRCHHSGRPRPVGSHRSVVCRSTEEKKKDDGPTEQATTPPLHSISVPVAERDGLEYLKLEDIRSKLVPRDSPFCEDNNAGGGFVGDKDLLQINIVQYESENSSGAQCQGLLDPVSEECLVLPQFAVRSGPREIIYHDPKDVTAAIVTCGGLCPGLNDVVLNIVTSLIDYGVPEDQILGIKYGLRGFLDRHAKPVKLGKQEVDGIQLKGGTVLGTSRGNAKITEIVERLRLWGVTQLYVIGGNGGNAAAHAIAQECLVQNVVCNVVGVPKSIDNDIQIIDRCFGFDTAVEEAQRSLICARVEARSAGGISVVKLMGRQSGFIAMNASMASGVVDVCLIPEIKFTTDKLLEFVGRILDNKGHCVVCVAEGAGQDILDGSERTDLSGNPILSDIGTYLRDLFKKAFPTRDVKYIDPSYMIRSIPTITTDRIYCKVLGQAAVHGAMAGYTDFTVGLVNTHYVMLPTTTIIQSARQVDPKGRQFNRLKTSLNQPDLS